MLSDLNSNLQASSYDDSIDSLHAESLCHVVIKAPSYFMSENINVMRKKNNKFNITIYYPYVWYENNLRPRSHCKNEPGRRTDKVSSFSTT